MSVTTPEGLITGAIEVINERGWAKYALVDDNGGVCVRGAMFTVLYDDPTTWPSESNRLWRETERRIMELVPIRFQEVADWNNDPNTTKEEVLRVLHLVAQPIAA